MSVEDEDTLNGGEPIIYDLAHCGIWLEHDWEYCPECGKEVKPY